MNLSLRLVATLALCALALCTAFALVMKPAHAASPLTNPSSVLVVSVGTALDATRAQEFANNNISYMQNNQNLGTCQQTSSTKNQDGNRYAIALVEQCTSINSAFPVARNQQVLFLANGFDPDTNDVDDASTSVASLASGFQTGAQATCTQLTQDATPAAYPGPQDFNDGTDDQVAVASLASDCTFPTAISPTNGTGTKNSSINNGHRSFKVNDFLRPSNTSIGTSSTRTTNTSDALTITITINL